LVRIVRTPAGSVEIDLTGKANGRGAYLCNNADCWDAALKRDRLSAALKVKLSAVSREKLAEFAGRLKGISPVSG